MGTKDTSRDIWALGDSYEPYVGRWSRLVAREFIHGLGVAENKQWLDVGCGTGALSQTILDLANPQNVKGIDRSEGFAEFARHKINHSQAEFEVGDAQALPVESERYDVAVSGLVLNFVPQPDQMLAEMRRAVGQKGVVALYVWDYAGKMQLMRHFWNAASALDPAAQALDEGRRFPICSPDALTKLFQDAGLAEIKTRPIDISMDFKDFDDYWAPFLGGQGPAPGYAMSLSEERRAQLRERIYNSLPFALDGSIPLVARAWAVRGVK
ncbi:MAG: methyltransferase domain-containing protein [Chloroflexi bacterium]|nr:MAG: methyltransferase domain-containing protein [Chloroflexota bacterium]